MTTFTVMYNARFGGYGFSDEAIRLYNQRKAELGQPTLKNSWEVIPRTDPVMIQIVRELHDRANSLFSRIWLEEIPSEYANHFSITEYDGNETIHIHYDQHALKCIEDIMDDPSLQPTDAIVEIRRTLNEYRTRHRCTRPENVQIRSTVCASFYE